MRPSPGAAAYRASALRLHAGPDQTGSFSNRWPNQWPGIRWAAPFVGFKLSARIQVEMLRSFSRRNPAIPVHFPQADSRETMVRSHDDIGIRFDRGMRIEPIEKLVEIRVGVADREARRLPVDPRKERAKAVALIVLRAVRVA